MVDLDWLEEEFRGVYNATLSTRGLKRELVDKIREPRIFGQGTGGTRTSEATFYSDHI